MLDYAQRGLELARLALIDELPDYARRARKSRGETVLLTGLVEFNGACQAR